MPRNQKFSTGRVFFYSNRKKIILQKLFLFHGLIPSHNFRFHLSPVTAVFDIGKFF